MMIDFRLIPETAVALLNDFGLVEIFTRDNGISTSLKRSQLDMVFNGLKVFDNSQIAKLARSELVQCLVRIGFSTELLPKVLCIFLDLHLRIGRFWEIVAAEIFGSKNFMRIVTEHSENATESGGNALKLLTLLSDNLTSSKSLWQTSAETVIRLSSDDPSLPIRPGERVQMKMLRMYKFPKVKKATGVQFFGSTDENFDCFLRELLMFEESFWFDSDNWMVLGKRIRRWTGRQSIRAIDTLAIIFRRSAATVASNERLILLRLLEKGFMLFRAIAKYLKVVNYMNIAPNPYDPTLSTGTAGLVDIFHFQLHLIDILCNNRLRLSIRDR